MYTPSLQWLNSVPHNGRSAAASSSSGTASTTATPGLDLTSTFLQLLTVQLKNQSPLDPLDPNAFIAQLAQFDSLGELTQIQELMQTLVTNTSPASAATSGSTKPDSTGYSSSTTQSNPIRT